LDQEYYFTTRVNLLKIVIFLIIEYSGVTAIKTFQALCWESPSKQLGNSFFPVIPECVRTNWGLLFSG